MPTEIERRFLVRPSWLPKPLPRGGAIVQGFLSLSPVVRVRLWTPPGARSPKAFMTVKGKGLRVRAEFEYTIPPADARALLQFCGDRVIRKTRHVLGPWEIDRFAGRHRGLWVAEIELTRASQALPHPLPLWLGPEVTDDPRFTNARLVQDRSRPPFWKKAMARTARNA